MTATIVRAITRGKADFGLLKAISFRFVNSHRVVTYDRKIAGSSSINSVSRVRLPLAVKTFRQAMPSGLPIPDPFSFTTNSQSKILLVEVPMQHNH